MAIHYVYGGPIDEPMAELWRFDVVGQRPPAVRLVARWSFLDSARMDCPDALPGSLGMLFEQLEIDVV